MTTICDICIRCTHRPRILITMTSTIGIPIKLLSEAQVSSDALLPLVEPIYGPLTFG